MTVYFLDTSALVKRYCSEIGSEQVNQIMADEANFIYISELAIVELVSALQQKRRMGQLDESDMKIALARLASDIASEIVVLAFRSGWIERARDVIIQYNLRSLDAIQLTAALDMRPLVSTFVCADAKLLEAAEGVGLETLNPRLGMRIF